jgi:hypothetical protein
MIGRKDPQTFSCAITRGLPGRRMQAGEGAWEAMEGSTEPDAKSRLWSLGGLAWK